MYKQTPHKWLCWTSSKQLWITGVELGRKGTKHATAEFQACWYGSQTMSITRFQPVFVWKHILHPLCRPGIRQTSAHLWGSIMQVPTQTRGWHFGLTLLWQSYSNDFPQSKVGEQLLTHAISTSPLRSVNNNHPISGIRLVHDELPFSPNKTLKRTFGGMPTLTIISTPSGWHTCLLHGIVNKSSAEQLPVRHSSASVCVSVDKPSGHVTQTCEVYRRREKRREKTETRGWRCEINEWWNESKWALRGGRAKGEAESRWRRNEEWAKPSTDRYRIPPPVVITEMLLQNIMVSTTFEYKRPVSLGVWLVESTYTTIRDMSIIAKKKVGPLYVMHAHPWCSCPS